MLGIKVFLHPEISVFDEVCMIALHPLRLSYIVLPFETLTEVSPLQLENAWSPMLVTESGMVMEVRPPIPLHRYAGITLTLLPKTKLLMFKQPLNTGELDDPADVQLSALNTTEVNPVQPRKADKPMEVTELGMVTEVNPQDSKAC